MNLESRDDVRKLGIWLGRIRAAIGIFYFLFPDRATTGWFGGSSGSASRKAMTRAFAIREFTIGLVTAIACAEGERGADWLSVAGATDAADTALTLFHPGLPLRARAMVLLTAPAAVAHYVLARKTHQLVEPKRTIEV